MAQVIGNQELIRKTNQRLMIDIVRQAGLISRADLAKTLQLSAPTVSANIDRLLKRDVLMEVGSGDSRGGRPPILLQLNPDYGFIAGMDLSSDKVRLALINFTGEILNQRAIPSAHLSGQEVLLAAVSEINSMMQEGQLDPARLLTVTLATPGVLDQKTQRLHLVPQYAGWEDFPIVDMAKEAFSCPVLIKNDINTATFGEIHYGAGVGYQSLAYISVDTGIGAGIVLNGQILEGSHGAAGEIGHMVHNPATVRPRKRGLGNLEAAASVPALLSEAATYMTFSSEGYLSQLEEMKAEIERGNAKIMELMLKAAHTIGYTLINLQTVLDLEMIIIGGAITTFGESYLNAVREVVNSLAPLPLTLVYSALGNRSVLKGAFVMAQEKVIEDLVNEG